MEERKLPLDQAHEFALAIKWREDFAAAVRALKRELWQVRWPALRFAGAVLVVSGAAFMMAGEPTALLNCVVGLGVWYLAHRRIIDGEGA